MRGLGVLGCGHLYAGNVLYTEYTTPSMWGSGSLDISGYFDTQYRCEYCSAQASSRAKYSGREQNLIREWEAQCETAS